MKSKKVKWKSVKKIGQKHAQSTMDRKKELF